MKLSKSQLSVLHAASTDTRYNLNGITIEADGRTVATDGHMLATVGSESIPEKAGESLTAPLCIAKAATKLARKAPVDLEYSALELSYKASNAESSETVTVDCEFGQYPDWRNVLPKGEPEKKVAISVALLEKLVAIARQFTETKKGDSTGLVFELRGEFDPISVKSAKNNEAGETLHAVLMPMRIK